jgi:serine/threonine protein kinase/tetratricopeptide (TPR) repeat protein
MLRAGLNDTVELGNERSVVPAESDSSEHRFEHYELLLREDGAPVELGRGAMGITYKAMDVNLRCPVALKVVNARYLDNELVRERFVSEARAAASLRHPNVASVFHLGKIGEDYFYAMELVEGEPLDRILRFRGPMDVDLALDIVDQVAAALSAAYQQGLVHRDIKPSNLIVGFGTEGRVMVKVIDFGLAKALRTSVSERRLSESGRFMGTPQFSSPEQCLGKEVDIRSDLYSLGITLWVMLTGQAPFHGAITEVMHKHVYEAPPVERLEHVPGPVVSLIESLLEKDPAKRPQTPYQLQTMIQEVREKIGVDFPTVGRRRQPVRLDGTHLWPRKGNLLILGCVVLGIAVACLVFVNRRAPPPIDPKSVAVLPFDNVGDDKQNEYFSDGLTADVIFQLSKISDLRVISRSSVLRYKAVPSAVRKPLPEIGVDLAVATILESSVERLGNRVKINAILYDARTDRRIWGEAYDREITDLFAIQSDVAENIAAALKVRLSGAERTDIQRKPTENLTAYDLYLRGMAFYELRHKEDNETAIAFFRQAVQQDPRFALGYVGLANAYIERFSLYEGEAACLERAAGFCLQAINIDPRQARGYSGLARAYSFEGRNDEASALTKKALELAPNDAEALKRAVYEAVRTGHLDEEYALLRKCSVVDPNDPSNPYALSQICAAIGETALTEKWVRHAVDLEPDPERRRMLDCERMIYRQEFNEALHGLRVLPLDLTAYTHTALELIVACSARVGDWNTVVRLASARLEQGAGNWRWDTWALFYLSCAARTAGHESEARDKADRLLASVPEGKKKEEPGEWGRVYLAVGNRILDQKEEAYRYLRTVFPVVLKELPLMRYDPVLKAFALDSEFQGMMSDADKEYEKMRARIHEIEKNL